MFGWSTLFPFMKLYATVLITGIFTKTSISIFLKRECLFKSLNIHINQLENSISSKHQVIRLFLYVVFLNVCIFVSRKHKIILIITNIILIHFIIIVSCVCSKPTISIGTFVINLLNLIDDSIFIY